MSNELNNKKLAFIEKMSLKMEENGHPRIAGEILGWLMICSPAHQSFQDITSTLNVSKASVSNMTRFLIQIGLIEKVRLQGNRHIYYQVKRGAWKDLLNSQLNQVDEMKKLSEEGLKIVAEEDKNDEARLKEMNAFYSFISAELPEIVDRFNNDKD